ncbi:MAG: NFACT RNA binding domain-containing protein [candidate division WOR-3 bacterium]
MIHYSFEDLLIFYEEFKRFGLSSIESLLKDGSSYYLISKNNSFCVKFVGKFPGYRLVHVPVLKATGLPVLTDLFPAAIKSFKVLNADRIFGLWLKGKIKEFGIIFELFGSLNNMFILNEDGKIIYCARKISGKRNLKPGAIYSLPDRKVLRQESLLDDYSHITCGYICEIDNNKILLKEHMSENCVKYVPYTYALDIFFESLATREHTRCIDKTLCELYINTLTNELDPDYVFESESYTCKNGLVIPVKKGTKCSKVIGYYRALIIKESESRSKKRNFKEQSSLFFEFVSPSGKKVLVGRSAKANSILTFNLAKSHDVLFHVRDYPGAHVVLFTQGKTPTQEDILFCAEKALLFSKAGSGKWEVIYAPISNVYRRRGMGAGKVLFKNYKTVIIEK